jgi:hypothetical protein
VSINSTYICNFYILKKPPTLSQIEHKKSIILIMSIHNIFANIPMLSQSPSKVKECLGPLYSSVCIPQAWSSKKDVTGKAPHRVQKSHGKKLQIQSR